MNNEKFMVANITWNPDGWRSIYTNPKAGHSYARKHPGHESLNFLFNKKGLDKKNTVYGFIQWTKKPKKFSADGIIFFYSKNLDNIVGEIIGVYGNANILVKEKRTPHKGFERDELISNISGEKSVSLLFPVPLRSEQYARGRKFGAQGGYTYIDSWTAERIIGDEISEVSRVGFRVYEFEKLKNIYRLITGKEYAGNAILNTDQKEQEELSKIIARQDRETIIKELEAIKPKSPEKIVVKGRQYKRDNKTIAQLKFLRDYKCQLCGCSVLKKDGSFYVEAAHILEKRYQGSETPDNILILCPNHHKEFDLGKREIIKHTKSKLVFNLNRLTFEIDLSFAL